MYTTTKTNLNVQVAEERLVVLISGPVDNLSDFARQVYWMAMGQQRSIVYAILDNCEEDTLSHTRLLSTLEALTQAEWLKVRSVQITGVRWADALHQVCQPGDIVVCSGEQAITGGAGSAQKAVKAVERELSINLHFLPDLFTPESVSSFHWVRPLLGWIAGFLILAGFSFLEFRLAGVLTGPLMKVILILLIGMEFAILYYWDRICQ